MLVIHFQHGERNMDAKLSTHTALQILSDFRPQVAALWHATPESVREQAQDLIVDMLGAIAMRASRKLLERVFGELADVIDGSSSVVE